MSARKGIYAITDVPCDGGVSPNAYVPKITSEVRLHFPPDTVTDLQVLDALARSYLESRRKVLEFFE